MTLIQLKDVSVNSKLIIFGKDRIYKNGVTMTASIIVELISSYY